MRPIWLLRVDIVAISVCFVLFLPFPILI
jgi:hypothetical protein